MLRDRSLARFVAECLNYWDLAASRTFADLCEAGAITDTADQFTFRVGDYVVAADRTRADYQRYSGLYAVQWTAQKAS